MIFAVSVGVALSRPPLIDEFRRYEIDTVSESEAELVACQIAACTSVMPVWAGWPDEVPHIAPTEVRGVL